VSVFRRLKNAFFNCTAQFTQTAEERPLFRVIRERNISRIVELGIGDAERSLRMIQAAVKANPGKTVASTCLRPGTIMLAELRSKRSTAS
jgi:hypothetical protein